MLILPDPATLAVVLVGALIAGFTTGFAGFGTGLVASGLWFHVLPAGQVPPLIVLTSVIAQVVGLITLRRAFDWPRAAPYLAGGALGVPLGVLALTLASPDLIRSAAGVLLVAYGLYRLSGFGNRLRLKSPGRAADGAIGMTGGVLSGFAGLGGPVPLIWLQLQGGSPDSQRATYQPFNLVVLSLAAVAMLVAGRFDASLATIVAFCVPITLAGARLGVAAYRRVGARGFERIILVLLLVSGAILVAQSLAG